MEIAFYRSGPYTPLVCDARALYYFTYFTYTSIIALELCCTSECLIVYCDSDTTQKLSKGRDGPVTGRARPGQEAGKIKLVGPVGKSGDHLPDGHGHLPRPQGSAVGVVITINRYG